MFNFQITDEPQSNKLQYWNTAPSVADTNPADRFSTNPYFRIHTNRLLCKDNIYE